jgi:anti-sigma regulatory factor (Ser/Thr protein kinase)
MTSGQNGSRAHQGDARHAAVLYDSDDDLRGRVLPYLRAGIDNGEDVVVIVSEPAEQAVRAGLGNRAAGIRWALPGMSYGHLGRASEAMRAFLGRHRSAGTRTRLLTENDVNDDPGRTAAYLRADAAANDLYGGFGFPWACLYDRRRHPAGVLAHAALVHPLLFGSGGQAAGNAAYVRPETYLAAHPGPLSPVPEPAALDTELADLSRLAGARHQVADAALVLGLGPEECRRAEVAAGEVIANAFKHGVVPCRIRVWNDPRAVFVRIDDQGEGAAVTTAGFRPPDPRRGSGAGLWVARQFSDIVQVGVGPAGTSIELQFPLT